MDQTTGIIIMALCYLFGSGLIIVEAFLPGFGVAGISGLLLQIIAIVLTATYFDTFWALMGTLAVLLFVGIAVFLSYRSAKKGRLNNTALVLKNSEEAAPTAPSADEWMDKEGTAVTALRPAGTVEIGGTRLNASTAGEFLPRGTAVKVIGAEGDHVVVRIKEMKVTC